MYHKVLIGIESTTTPPQHNTLQDYVYVEALDGPSAARAAYEKYKSPVGKRHFISRITPVLEAEYLANVAPKIEPEVKSKVAAIIQEQAVVAEYNGIAEQLRAAEVKANAEANVAIKSAKSKTIN